MGKIGADADAPRMLPDAGGAVVWVVTAGNIHIERRRYFVAVKVCVVAYAAVPILPVAVILAIVDFDRCAIRRTRQLRVRKLPAVLSNDVWDPKMDVPMIRDEIGDVELHRIKTNVPGISARGTVIVAMRE